LLVIPAVDVMQGKCVRLRQGRPIERRIYSEDPVQVVKKFSDEGAELIHLVDLDAALGIGQNREVVQKCIESGIAKIQVAGGIRGMEKAESILKMGAYRIVVGTIVARHPELVSSIAGRYGADRVAVAVDAKADKVSIEGWTQQLDLDYLKFAKSLESTGAGMLVFTQIEVDGTLKGCSISRIAELLKTVKIPVVASGGIRDLSDLVVLSKLGVFGAIVGTALYEKRFTLKDAMRAVGYVD